jgi:hypothetical protein
MKGFCMAECDWLILCDYAFLDVSRKICIIGAFDKVFAPAVPSALHQSSIAAKLLGNPNENVNFRIVIARPGGGQLASIQGNLLIPDSGAAQIQVNIAGLALPDYGPYSVTIYTENEVMKTTSFVVDPPPAAQHQVPAG